MGLKGKFEYMDGERPVFSSPKKGNWKPIPVAGHAWEMVLKLQQGKYYDIDLNDERAISRLQELPPFQGTGSGQSTGGGQSRGSQQYSQTKAHNDLMSCVTGILKSAIEATVIDKEGNVERVCDPRSHDSMKAIALNAWQVLNSLGEHNKRMPGAGQKEPNEEDIRHDYRFSEPPF